MYISYITINQSISMKRILAFCLVAISLSLASPSFASPPIGDQAGIAIFVPSDSVDVVINSATEGGSAIIPDFPAEIGIVVKEAHVGDVSFSGDSEPGSIGEHADLIINSNTFDANWYPLYNWYRCSNDSIKSVKKIEKIAPDEEVPIQRE